MDSARQFSETPTPVLVFGPVVSSLCLAPPFARMLGSVPAARAGCRHFRSGQPQPLDVFKRREEGLEILAVAEDSIHQASAGCDDLAGYLHEVDQETLEFHAQDLTAHLARSRHQAVPGLEIPSERRDDHV